MQGASELNRSGEPQLVYLSDATFGRSPLRFGANMASRTPRLPNQRNSDYYFARQVLRGSRESGRAH